MSIDTLTDDEVQAWADSAADEERVLDFTEAGDVTVTDAEQVDTYNDLDARKDLVRNLVVSGGQPYILIVIGEEGVDLTFQGLPPNQVAPGLIELGEALLGKAAA